MNAVTIEAGSVVQAVRLRIQRTSATVPAASLSQVHTSSIAEDVQAADVAIAGLWESLKQLSS
jgi:hypothetical protein